MHCALFTAGYPVLRNRVEFKRAGFVAIKEEWARFMMAAKVPVAGLTGCVMCSNLPCFAL